MGLDLKFGLAKVLSFVKLGLGADVTVNPGGGANPTGKHLAPPGDDSQPLPQDFAGVVPSAAEGSINIAGYVDADNALEALAGEKRLYSRNEAGAVMVTIWLKRDGKLLIDSDGEININGVTISSSGAVSIPTSLKVAGKELAGHNHEGSPSAPSGAVSDTGANQ
jgi:hypothetical protein